MSAKNFLYTVEPRLSDTFVQAFFPCCRISELVPAVWNFLKTSTNSLERCSLLLCSC